MDYALATAIAAVVNNIKYYEDAISRMKSGTTDEWELYNPRTGVEIKLRSTDWFLIKQIFDKQVEDLRQTIDECCVEE